MHPRWTLFTAAILLGAPTLGATPDEFRQFAKRAGEVVEKATPAIESRSEADALRATSFHLTRFNAAVADRDWPEAWGIYLDMKNNLGRVAIVARAAESRMAERKRREAERIRREQEDYQRKIDARDERHHKELIRTLESLRRR